MPSDMGYSYADMSYQEQKIQNGIGIVQIFLLSSVFVFLILAACMNGGPCPSASS